ncbi:MAG TPA: PAAR domain-containing protein [Acidobacteriaceae bacterium]
MGMPACTITSQTAHGGIVILGFPTVLIGMMPASRVTDMHVCPMVTGVVPHVGGPFILGSPTVIVGEMMQSRVTDQLTCVGPPDVALMGCETVLVGAAGGAGAAGAAAGVQAMGAQVPMQTAGSGAQGLQSELQQNGTIKTSAPPGGRLPPITLAQQGWPDLPFDQAPNFQDAQPVTLPPGTPLYRVVEDESRGGGAYWTPWLPNDEELWRKGCAVERDFNQDGKVAVYTVPPGPGLNVWMGRASKQTTYEGGGVQFYMKPGTIQPHSVAPSPWHGKSGSQ